MLQDAVDQARSEQQAQANVVTDLQNKLNQATQTATKTNVQIHVTDELKQAVQKYVNNVYANVDKTTLNNDAKAIQDALTNPKNMDSHIRLLQDLDQVLKLKLKITVDLYQSITFHHLKMNN